GAQPVIDGHRVLGTATGICLRLFRESSGSRLVHGAAFYAASPAREQRGAADPLNQLGEFDTGYARGLRQQASGGHARDGMRLQAPESPLRVHPEIDPAVLTELQGGVGPQRELLHFRGRLRAQLSRKYLAGAALLIFRLVVEHFTLRENLAHRKSLFLEDAD